MIATDVNQMWKCVCTLRNLDAKPRNNKLELKKVKEIEMHAGLKYGNWGSTPMSYFVA